MKIKNILSLAAFTVIIASPFATFAQTTQKGGDVTSAILNPPLVAAVQEGDRAMSQGIKNALAIELPKISAKNAEKLWKDYMKQFKGETKKDKKTDEWFTDNALISSIGGANSIDIYSKFADSGENTTVSMWIDLGGAYVNSRDFKDKYTETEKILANFSLIVQREQTKTLLSDQSDALKKLEKQEKNLEKDNQNLHDDIESWKKKIIKAEEDIKTNLKNQDDTKAKIEAQKKLVDDIQKKLNMFN